MSCVLAHSEEELLVWTAMCEEMRQRGASAVQPLVSGHADILVWCVGSVSDRLSNILYPVQQPHIVGHVLVVT